MPGRYLIENKGKFLVLGWLKPADPYDDVPARILEPYYATPWWIEPVESGYTIRENHNVDSFKLVAHHGKPFFSTRKEPSVWVVSPAGDGLFTIGLVNKDLLITNTEKGLATLEPANGSPLQKWSLQAHGRRRNLDRNRFQHIF
ncbi:hypothetical protein EC968_004579 [Mortierella alpina]|nr:hypothetical protein EC968_004579 [Mortierella alpina]